MRSTPAEIPKSVGVLTPASGSVDPPGVGEVTAIVPVVGVGVDVEVAPGGVVGVGVAVTLGGKVGEGVDVNVGVTVPVTVGVGEFWVSVKVNCVHCITCGSHWLGAS